MVIGVLQLQLAIYDSFSLKDRRRAVKSLKERLRNRFNVSVAEVGDLESRRSAELAVAMVANDGGFVQQALQQIANYVERDHGTTLISFDIETL